MPPITIITLHPYGTAKRQAPAAGLIFAEAQTTFVKHRANKEKARLLRGGGPGF
jgi:hypothetical protein